MKRILLLYISLLSSFLITAQVNISGTVFDLDGNPLEGASVYLNNTSIGTTTNMEGEFYLNLPKGKYKLVVSYVGYTSDRYPLDTQKYTKPIVFKLVPKINVLDEVVIERRKKIGPNQRKEFLKIFRREFLGVSKVAKKCKIVNEDVIDFDFNEETTTLEAFAREPLKIINKSLGYTVFYDLTTFEMSSKGVTYLGNVRYEEKSGSKSQKKRWNIKRRKAYKGSSVHFLRALMDDKLQKEGFIVDHIQRIPNPERPSMKEIKQARDILKRVNNTKVSSYMKNPVSEREVIIARTILDRVKLNPYIERLIKVNVKSHEFTLEYDGKKHLMFDNFLRIKYMREWPDKNYRLKHGFTRYQTSIISLNEQEVEVLKSGALSDPLDALLYGYWGFERVGDGIPLDYEPN